MKSLSLIVLHLNLSSSLKSLKSPSGNAILTPVFISFAFFMQTSNVLLEIKIQLGAFTQFSEGK